MIIKLGMLSFIIKQCHTNVNAITSSLFPEITFEKRRHLNCITRNVTAITSHTKDSFMSKISSYIASELRTTKENLTTLSVQCLNIHKNVLFESVKA